MILHLLDRECIRQCRYVRIWSHAALPILYRTVACHYCTPSLERIINILSSDELRPHVREIAADWTLPVAQPPPPPAIFEQLRLSLSGIARLKVSHIYSRCKTCQGPPSMGFWEWKGTMLWRIITELTAEIAELNLSATPHDALNSFLFKELAPTPSFGELETLRASVSREWEDGDFKIIFSTCHKLRELYFATDSLQSLNGFRLPCLKIADLYLRELHTPQLEDFLRANITVEILKITVLHSFPLKECISICKDFPQLKLVHLRQDLPGKFW